MRNRRAAQESRDRKKRQFEALEDENRLLQEENKRMKVRIEQLESQQSSFNLPFHQILSTHPQDPVLKCEPLSPENFTCEPFSPEEFESTFHPAAVEYDLQCPYSTFLVN
jgi:bZIP transcription factor